MLVCMIYVGSLFFLFLSKLFASLHVCLATKKCQMLYVLIRSIDIQNHFFSFKKKVVAHTKKKTEGMDDKGECGLLGYGGLLGGVFATKKD